MEEKSREREPEPRSKIKTVDIINLVSSIFTITGISLLWMKQQLQLSIPSIVAIAVISMAGLFIMTMAVNWYLYLLELVRDSWRKPHVFSFQLLAIFFMVVIAIVYIKFSEIRLFPLVYNALK